MRNPGGYAVITSPVSFRSEGFDGFQCVEVSAGNTELDSFTCGHCNFIVHVQARTDPANLGGLCKMCMKLICPNCYADGSCTPFEKRLEAIEEADYRRRQYAMGT